MKQDFIFTASDGEQLAVTAYGTHPPRSSRCIIYVHGFKGFKDWGFVPYLGTCLADRGLFVLTFNFSHNGIGADPLEFTELDKFARNTLSREVRELSEIIDAYRNGVFGPVENPKVALLGHSRGGGIALLTAVRKPEIEAAVVWSSVASFDRYSDRAKREWRENGSIEVINQRTGQIMRLNLSLLEDLEKHADDLLNIEKAVRNLNRPLLVIHGEADESVPSDEAAQIHAWADPNRTRLVIVPGTGHTFDARHPFDRGNEKLDLVLETTARFFDEHL